MTRKQAKKFLKELARVRTRRTYRGLLALYDAQFFAQLPPHDARYLALRWLRVSRALRMPAPDYVWAAARGRAEQHWRHLVKQRAQEDQDGWF